jgi:hypothetical protein
MYDEQRLRSNDQNAGGDTMTDELRTRDQRALDDYEIDEDTYAELLELLSGDSDFLDDLIYPHY